MTRASRLTKWRSASLGVAALAVACTKSPSEGSAPLNVDVSVSHPYEPANTMTFTVDVTLPDHGDDADHDVTVAFAPAGTDCETGTWTSGRVQRFATADSMSWILYNFQPDEAYDYRVRLGADDPMRVQCGELGTPRLPDALAALHLSYAKGDYATRYVLLDTADCSPSGEIEDARPYMIALDPDSEKIVWYLDVAGRSTLGGRDLSGWRYQPSGGILATVDRRYFYEWAFDGTVTRAKDIAPQGECSGTDAYGPCPHHDAFRSEFSGKTYIVASGLSSIDGTGTSWDSCGTDSRFLGDGFQIWDESLSTSETKDLITDYGFDPLADEGPTVAVVKGDSDACDAHLWADYFGPYGAIDWTHINSITASSFGGTEVLDLSLKGWNQILRVDDAGTVLWRLSPHGAYSDWPLTTANGIAGPAGFSRQHDAHAISEDEVMVFDNDGDESASRILQIDLGSDIAVISRSWVVVDESGDRLACRIHGSAQPVSGTDGASVLGMCNDKHTIVEISDGTGNAAIPPLAISLPQKGFCDVGGPASVTEVRGWYRAFPMETIGEF